MKIFSVRKLVSDVSAENCHPAYLVPHEETINYLIGLEDWWVPYVRKLLDPNLTWNQLQLSRSTAHPHMQGIFDEC